MQFRLSPYTISWENEGSIYGTKEVLLYDKCEILHRQIWWHTTYMCVHYVLVAVSIPRE